MYFFMAFWFQIIKRVNIIEHYGCPHAYTSSLNLLNL